MLSDLGLYLEKGDRIECRTGGEFDPAPHQPILELGGARVYATVGQLAALRDVLDRWLCGEGPESDEDEFARASREADDRDCRAEEV